MFNKTSMSIFELMKVSILKYLQGSWSWVHGQQIKTWPVKIRNVSKIRLESSQQMLIKGLHNARLTAGHETPGKSRTLVDLVRLTLIVRENYWFGGVSPSPESFSRCRVVRVVPSSNHITLQGHLAFTIFIDLLDHHWACIFWTKNRGDIIVGSCINLLPLKESTFSESAILI